MTKDKKAKGLLGTFTQGEREALIGSIICLTGCDLSGKSTQAKMLTMALDAAFFKFPRYDDEVVGPKIKEMLKDGTAFTDSDTFQLLNQIGRIRAQDEMLEAGQSAPIVCDRYDIDAFIFKCADYLRSGDVSFGFSEDFTQVKYQERTMATYGIIPSNLVIALIGSPYDREEKDAYEKDTEFQDIVKSLYLTIAREFNPSTLVIPINVEGKSIEEVHADICDCVKYYLEYDLGFTGSI